MTTISAIWRSLGESTAQSATNQERECKQVCSVSHCSLECVVSTRLVGIFIKHVDNALHFWHLLCSLRLCLQTYNYTMNDLSFSRPHPYSAWLSAFVYRLPDRVGDPVPGHSSNTSSHHRDEPNANCTTCKLFYFLIEFNLCIVFLQVWGAILSTIDSFLYEDRRPVTLWRREGMVYWRALAPCARTSTRTQSHPSDTYGEWAWENFITTKCKWPLTSTLRFWASIAFGFDRFWVIRDC